MIDVLVPSIYRMESPSYCREWVTETCISSSVCPFVSGTNFATNKTAEPQTPMYMKNVPEIVYRPKFFWSISKKKRMGHKEYQKELPAEFHSIIKLKLYVTIQEQDQFTKDTRLIAEPFTLMGNTCYTNLILQSNLKCKNLLVMKTDIRISLKDSLAVTNKKSYIPLRQWAMVFRPCLLSKLQNTPECGVVLNSKHISHLIWTTTS